MAKTTEQNNIYALPELNTTIEGKTPEDVKELLNTNN